MVKDWDGWLKRLIGEKPQDFVSWLVKGGRFVRELSPHLQTGGLDADILLEITVEGRRCLLHIEFQARGDVVMGDRLILYNILARRKYKVPVCSFVVYLKKDSKVISSPYEWETCIDTEKSVFHFKPIKLWDIPTSTLKAMGLPGLLPLLPLTQEGKRIEIVEEMIEALGPSIQTPQWDLLMIGMLIAAKVFPQGPDRDRLLRRSSMLKDALREVMEGSWLWDEFKEMVQEKVLKDMRAEGRVEGREEGRVEGREEGRVEGREEGKIEGRVIEVERHRRSLVTLVETRFTELTALAKERGALIEDPEQLENLLLKVAIARNSEGAERALLEAGDE